MVQTVLTLSALTLSALIAWQNAWQKSMLAMVVESFYVEFVMARVNARQARARNRVQQNWLNTVETASHKNVLLWMHCHLTVTMTLFDSSAMSQASL
jgi:hypothetical protein